MQQWEYITVTIARVVTKEPGFFRGKGEYTWTARLSDGMTIEGVDNVLNVFGERGWEMINILPSTLGPNGIPLKLTAFFKRPASPAGG